MSKIGYERQVRLTKQRRKKKVEARPSEELKPPKGRAVALSTT